MPSAIIIGSDPNGLAAALTLAGKGWDVQIFEPSAQVGGVAAAEEFAPGFRSAGVLHDDGLLSRKICDGLGLAKFGLRWREHPRERWLAGESGGITLANHDDEATAAEIARHSDADASHWGQWRRFVNKSGPALRKLLEQGPPDVLNSKTLRTGMQVAKAAVSVRALGREDMFELLRAMPMASRDFADDHFTTPLLKAGLVAPGLLGTWGGPWSPGSATPWLFAESINGAGVEGGPAALVQALVAACEQAGVSISAGQVVASIDFKAERAAGVTLASGESFAATAVLSALDPRTTCLDLIHPRHLPLRLERQISTFRARGVVASLLLAVDKPLTWGAPSDCTSVHVGSSLPTLERAFDPVKYGNDTGEPWLDIRIPSHDDNRLAPAGSSVLSILATGFMSPGSGAGPLDHHVADMAADERADAAYDSILNVLGEHLPGVHESVVGYKLRLPDQLATEFSLAGGHLWHGEHALDQLLSFRPTATCSGGKTPVDGLFLCSGGVHPGGGIRCVNGVLAARHCLAE